MRLSNSFLIAGLDIGTSKVSVLVAECTKNEVNIIGLGTSPSFGLKRGIITNIDATTQAIHQAISAAEKMANRKIKQVYTGISGSHIYSLNSYGTVSLDHREVTQEDVDRVMRAAQAIAIPKGHQFLHILSQEFIVDNQSGIREPIGMSGLRLKAKAHIVTGAVNAAQNIIKCVQNCGVKVADIILEPLASSQTVLTDDEKELGVCLLDIGGGTADVALFNGGAIRHTAIIPVAGDHVTRDIAILLHTSTETAEAIKRKYAHALSETAGNDWIELMMASNNSSRNIPVKTLAEVVGARYEELFQLAAKEIETRGYRGQFPVGLVLTGGGSHVSGALDLAAQIFKVPVRQGFPDYEGNLATTLRHGCHATGVGLIYYGHQHTLQHTSDNPFQSMYQHMQSWFRRNF